MDDVKLIKIEDILGEFGFTLRWQLLPHWADITAFQKVATEEQEGADVALYERKGATQSGDTVYHIDEAEPYLDGYVKWDGCAELDQGRPHWCGGDGFQKHCDLLRYIWIRSQQLIDRADRDLFGTWSQSETGSEP